MFFKSTIFSKFIKATKNIFLIKNYKKNTFKFCSNFHIHRCFKGKVGQKTKELKEYDTSPFFHFNYKCFCKILCGTDCCNY